MKRIILILIFIGIALSAHCQKFTFFNYSTKQGLAQSQVNDIAQDSKRYIWVATLGGLSRFDGKNFANIDESKGLLSNKVNSIFIDEKDNIWTVTEAGISIVTGDTVEQFFDNARFQDMEILEVIHFQNKIWVSTFRHGIFCYQKTKSVSSPSFIKEYSIDFINLKIRDINVINSSLYVATDSGFFSIFNQVVKKQPFIENIDISAICENSKGEIWMSTSQKGAFIVNNRDVVSINQDNSALSNNYLTNIFVDRNDRVWLCSNSELTEISRNLNLQSYNEENGFAKPSVVFEDVEGNIWIGTGGSGLIKFANKEFLYITKNKKLNSERIMAINEDKEGNIWLGSYGNGIAKKGKNITSYKGRESALPSDNIWTFLKDADDVLWIGTSEGLCKYDKGRFTNFTTEDGLPDNKVQSLFQETPGVLWIGTKEGVTFYKDNKFHEIDTLPYRYVRAISSTQDGMYWFGTSYGLVQYDGFESILIQDSIMLDNRIYSVIPYGNKLWIGTEKGLIYFDGSSFKQYYFTADEYQSQVNFLHLDKSNFLWIGTNNGVFTIDITAHSQGKKVIKTYTTNNGLIGMETNQNSIFEDSKGDIWFGTSEGINVYKRDNEVRNEEVKPSIHLTNLKLFFEDKNYLSGIEAGEILNFEYKQNTVAFYYQTNFFRDPNAVKYSYKLFGLEEEWSPMESTNFARYPNLSHGSYTFMVRSTVDGKTWSEIEEVSFVIKAPYWLTLWFRSSTLLVLFGVVFYFIYRRRSTLKKEREVELLNYKNKLIKLEQQSLNASMNRHFIFNSLNSIQFYINKEDKLSANRYLSNFSKLIRKNLDSSSAEDNLIPLSEEIERLTLYLSLENMRFKDKFRYKINMSEEVDSEMTMVPAMFMQPFIENSIWHGVLPKETPGEIIIDIYKNAHKTHFEITDNGIGIDTSIKSKSKEQNEHSSKGMKIATNRIELLQKVIQKEITIEGPFEMKENGETLGTKVIIIFG